MKETVAKINKTKIYLRSLRFIFEKINKFDKPLARFIKKRRRLKSIQLEMKKEK